MDSNKIKSIYNLIKESVSEDDKYAIGVYKNDVSDGNYLREWTREQDVKLLTLDGTLGGVNGKRFDRFSADLSAQDDWKIGKKYNMQGWFRYPIVIYEDDNNKQHIRYAEYGTEEHNAYLVVSKREMRGENKSLKRAKTNELEAISNAMVDKFIETFNDISNGDVYSIYFCRDEEVYGVMPVYGNIINSIGDDKKINEILSNIPFNDTEFDGLLRKTLYAEAV